MKIVKLTLAGAVALLMTACGSSAKEDASKSNDGADQTAAVTDDPNPSATEDSSTSATVVDDSANEDLIKTVYEKFVFGFSEDGVNDYFTDNALKKLSEAYDMECEGGNCYGFWELRTMSQDGPEDTSSVTAIEPIDDGWYAVTYSDMGVKGTTNIKIVDGKIDDYKRVK